jgi:large subunit ribosomal protein L21
MRIMEGALPVDTPAPLKYRPKPGAASPSRRTFFMAYAVIRTGGKQYRVAPGDVIRIERLAGEVGAEVAFTEVLLTAADGAVRIGTPLVEGVTVQGQIVGQGRDRKILVFKKKRRKNYRRRRGHRQSVTTVRVTAIA